MALTQEEIEYFNNGINALCKKATTKAKAKTYINPELSSKEVLDKLSEYLTKDFVSSTSALGINIPSSVLVQSKSDIAQIQVTVGMVPNENSNSPNIMSDVDFLKNNVEIVDNSLNSLTTQIVNIENLLAGKYNHNFNDQFIVTSKNTTLTACILRNNHFVLGEKITESHNTILGILKIILDCVAWANKKNDHFFTTDGTVESCSNYIPDCQAFTKCVGALGVNIDITNP